MKRLPSFLFYLLYFASLVFIQPFTILYFQELGFTGIQLGVLAGILPLILMLGAPLWTGLADAHNRHRRIMNLTIIATVLFASFFPLVKSFSAILTIVILYALFAAPIISFADSATLSMLAEHKGMYGRIRLGGTLGWGLAAPLAGLIIQAYGIRWAFWGYAAILFCTLFICQKFSYAQKPKQETVGGNIRLVLRDRRWILLLTFAFVGGIAFAIGNSFLFPYMNELKINKSTMEIALTISTISELPVLFFADRLLKRFTARGLLVLAMLITGVRLLLYAALNFQTGILVFQLLNGMTFPMFWVAGVSYANEISPEGMKATAQGLWGAMISGVGASTGGLVGGLVLGGIGGRGLFLSAGIFILFSLLVITLVQRRQPARTSGSLG